MLNTEQIKKNYERFFKGAQKYGFFTEELVQVLGENFIKAPASTLKDRHNAFEGGLCDHVLRVTEIALKLNKSLPEGLKSADASIIKVGFLHQIGKTNMYTPCTSQWHKDNMGKMYDYVNSEVPMSVGERSIFMIAEAGIKLTEMEYQAILNFGKPSDDLQANYHTCNLGELLSQAIEWAIREEKILNN